MLLSEQAVKLLIDELLGDYFNSVSYKIMLYLACLEKETELVNDIIEILKKSQSKKKKKEKSSSKIKIKKKLKIKSESVIKILFLKYIIIILIILILFIKKELNFNNIFSEQAFSF